MQIFSSFFVASRATRMHTFVQGTQHPKQQKISKATVFFYVFLICWFWTLCHQANDQTPAKTHFLDEILYKASHHFFPDIKVATFCFQFDGHAQGKDSCHFPDFFPPLPKSRFDTISTCDDSGAVWKAICGLTWAHEQHECILATPQNMQETPAKIAVIVHHLRLLEPKLASPLNLMAWTGLKSIAETVLYHRHKRSPPSRAAVDFESFVPGFGVSGGVVLFFWVCQNKVSTPGIFGLCTYTWHSHCVDPSVQLSLLQVVHNKFCSWLFRQELTTPVILSSIDRNYQGWCSV